MVKASLGLGNALKRLFSSEKEAKKTKNKPKSVNKSKIKKKIEKNCS